MWMDFGGVLSAIQSSPETSKAVQYFEKYSPIALSVLFWSVGYALIFLTGIRMRRRMKDLCGEEWSNEWYEHVEIQINDTVMRRYRSILGLTSQVLIFLGLESTVLGWSKELFEITSIYAVILFVISYMFEDRVIRWSAKRAKARAEKRREKENPVDEKHFGFEVNSA